MMPVFLIAFISACVSVLSAIAADSLLAERISIIGSFAGLQYTLNPGVAFGITFPPLLQVSLIAIALLAVIWMARGVRDRTEAIAYGLVLGGGIANIVDRLPDGVVTDYFQIGTFPVFNVADSCITVGVFLLLLEMIVGRRAKMKDESGKS